NSSYPCHRSSRAPSHLGGAKTARSASQGFQGDYQERGRKFPGPPCPTGRQETGHAVISSTITATSFPETRRRRRLEIASRGAVEGRARPGCGGRQSACFVASASLR